MSEPRPVSGPTNNRPWPGDFVMINGTSTIGEVEDYEYGWNSHVFPVRIARGTHFVSETYGASAVTVISSAIARLPERAARKRVTPKPAAHTTAAEAMAAGATAGRSRTTQATPTRKAGVA